MVTTRSGKPLLPASKGMGLKSRSKPAAAIFIFEEPICTESKKRESPCKIGASELKKSKLRLDDLVDKENCVKINQIQPPSSLQNEPKKIQISQDEKLMSGAPEGDLFDMVVFEDSELWPFSNDNEATDEFVKCCKIHDESTIWADQYESVVVIRRVVLHHAHILNSQPSMLLEASKAIVTGVESLRSCRVRSGIMGLRTLLKNCGMALSSMFTTDATKPANETDPCAAVVTSLLIKTGGGPKFISELALNSLLHEAVAGVPPLELIRCLFPSISHKNPEVGASATYATAECVRKLDFELLSSEEGVPSLKETVLGLAIALNNKRPKAKECAKMALRELSTTVGDAHFQRLLKEHVGESLLFEVQRALTVANSSSSSSCATPSTPSATSAVRPGSSLAMAMSVSNTNKFVRKPLAHPSSASSTVGSSAVSKFKLHMMATAGASSSSSSSSSSSNVVNGGIGDISAEIVLAVVPTVNSVTSTPASAPASAPASRPVGLAGRPLAASGSSTARASASDSASASASATPVLSMREHILMMKQKQKKERLAAQEDEEPVTVAATPVVGGSREQVEEK